MWLRQAHLFASAQSLHYNLVCRDVCLSTSSLVLVMVGSLRKVVSQHSETANKGRVIGITN